MNRKHSSVIALIILVTIVLSACAQPTPTPAQKPAATTQPAAQPTAAPAPTKAPEPTKAPAPTTAPAKKVELVFRQSDAPAEVEGLVQAVNAWNAKNPNIQVKFETVPWSDAQAQLVREVQAGGGPDVVQIAFVWTRDLGKNGLLMDIAPKLKSDPVGKGLDDLLALDLAQQDNKIYGVPWTVDTYVIAYRPDLFEAAGIKEFPDTWDDFKAAAKKLTVDKNKDGRTDQYGFCFPAGSAAGGGMWFLVNYYQWSNGKWFLEPGPDGKYRVGVTANDVATTMRYWQSFFKEGISPESNIGISSWSDPELISGLSRGDCAMIMAVVANLRQAQSQTKSPIITAAMPRGSVKRAAHLGGRTLAINPKTKYPDEAWQVLKHLASAETFKTYNQFPAQKSLFNELKFGDDLQGWVKQLPVSFTFKQYIDSPATTNSMWEATNREFGAMYSGQKTVEQASADLVKAMQGFLDAKK